MTKKQSDLMNQRSFLIYKIEDLLGRCNSEDFYEGYAMIFDDQDLRRLDDLVARLIRVHNDLITLHAIAAAEKEEEIENLKEYLEDE